MGIVGCVSHFRINHKHLILIKIANILSHGYKGIINTTLKIRLTFLYIRSTVVFHFFFFFAPIE